jgi:phage terminase large subunit-like protein
MAGTQLRRAASLAEQMAELPQAELDAIMAEMSDDDAFKLVYDWPTWARPNQMPPTDADRARDGLLPWFVWLLLGGRGMGKTRTGAETIINWVEEASYGEPIRIALVGQTSADVRDVMLQGESGILTLSPPWNVPTYLASSRRVQWPNGSYAILFSGDAPDQLRGPQFHKAWVDELAKFQYPQETWDNLEFGLRLGEKPQVVVTTTPRPIPIVKQMLEDPQVHVTRGSSYENISHLAPSFIQRVIRKYEGTRVGRQELHAEVLLDMPGALWNYDMIEGCRVARIPEMKRIVVAIDPAVTAHEDSDETGIIVAGKGIDGHGYVLRDLSGRWTTDEWASMAVKAYFDYGADRIIAEVNNGGDLVETVLRAFNRNVPYKAVHASRGKYRRAEPVSALYERGMVHHHGQFAQMEDQMTTFNPEEAITPTERRRTKQLSPDRMDAMVWAFTELMLLDNNDHVRGWGAVKR